MEVVIATLLAKDRSAGGLSLKKRIARRKLVFALLFLPLTPLEMTREVHAQWSTQEQIRDVIARDIVMARACPLLRAFPYGGLHEVKCEGGTAELSNAAGGGIKMFVGVITGVEQCNAIDPCVVDYRMMCTWRGLLYAKSCDGFGFEGLARKARITFLGKQPILAEVVSTER